MSHTFQPPPDGFGDALKRSRTRRRRRHLLEAATGSTTLAVIAAIVVSVHPGGLASLRRDQTAGHGLTTNPVPSVPAISPVATPTPDPSTPLSPNHPTGTGSPYGAAATPTSPPEQPSSPSTPGEVLISTAPVRRTTSYNNLSPCADPSGRQATGWCVQPGSSFTGRAGQPNELSASLCRLPGVLDGQASFPTSLESSFSIQTPSPPDKTLWDLQQQHPGHPSQHSVAVTAGQCLTWSVTWLGRNNSANDLPAGKYTLVVSINADNIGAPNQVITENYDYTITN